MSCLKKYVFFFSQDIPEKPSKHFVNSLGSSFNFSFWLMLSKHSGINDSVKTSERNIIQTLTTKHSLISEGFHLKLHIL